MIKNCSYEKVYYSLSYDIKTLSLVGKGSMGRYTGSSRGQISRVCWIYTQFRVWVWLVPGMKISITKNWIMSVGVSICLSVCRGVCLSVGLSGCRSVCPAVHFVVL